MSGRPATPTNVTTEPAIELDIYKNINHSYQMNITAKDKVIDLSSGSQATVIATHTYKEEGIQVASIKIDGNGSLWVPVTQLKKV
jgi:hypothetical protein